jgi:PAS domain-containing protein
MSKKPTYEELLQKVNALEKKIKQLEQAKHPPTEIEYIRHLIKFAPYGMFLIDLSSFGKIIACNDIGAERLGTTTEKAIGTVLKDYFPPDIAKRRQMKGFEAVESGKSVSFEDRVGDRYYQNIIYPIFNDHGKIDKLAIYGTDITEFKIIENKMFESEERYRAIFDRSLDCYFVSDLNGNFLDANQAALNLLGYNREEIPSLSFASLLNEDQLSIGLDAIKEIIETGTQKDSLELKLRKKMVNSYM